MPSNRKTNMDLSKCPPALAALIGQKGNVKAAGKALNFGLAPLRQMATGKRDIPASLLDKIKLLIGDDGSPSDPPEQGAPFFDKAKLEIPEWDGKTTTHKITKKDGSKITVKGLPVELVEVLARNQGSMTKAAKAIGLSGWAPIQMAIEEDRWGKKLHAKAWCYLNGLPIPNGKRVDADGDAHSLGIVVAQVPASNFERLEELAEVLKGGVAWKMTTGAGYVVIYKMPNRDDREKFKRLAARDAKNIACP